MLPSSYGQWKLKALLQNWPQEDGYIKSFFITQSATITQYNLKGLDNSGGMYNFEGDQPALVGLFDVYGGVTHCFYDRTLNVFHRVKTDKSAWEQLVPGTGYGNVTFYPNVVFHRINPYVFAYASSSNDNTEYHLGIYSDLA
jgi:hypothetical protein